MNIIFICNDAKLGHLKKNPTTNSEQELAKQT